MTSATIFNAFFFTSHAAVIVKVLIAKYIKSLLNSRQYIQNFVLVQGSECQHFQRHLENVLNF